MNPCSIYSRPLPPPPSPAPSWADPRAMMAATAWRFVTVDVPIGVVTQVAPPDPRRVSIGFVTDPATGLNGRIRPGDTPEWAGWLLETPGEPLWFDLFTFGAMVNLGWVMTGNANGTLGYHELYRLQ